MLRQPDPAASRSREGVAVLLRRPPHLCAAAGRVSPEVPTISTTLSPDAATTPDTAQALLFDCDGTLVDSVATWEGAWIRALAEYGVPITSDWYRARAGLSPRDLVHAAERDAGAPLDLDVVLARGIALYVDSATTVRPNQPVLEIARTHHGRVPLAVVSGGPRVGVDAALAAVGARHLFDHVITVDDVSRGKPAPDLYLRALEVLGRTARSCLAYEDSDEGLRAAAAAGIPVIDVRRGTVASAP